jgi:adenylate cyclase
MATVVATGSLELAASPDKVWPLITDTDRTNRLIGTNPVKFRPIEAGTKSSARFVGETSAGGFHLEYEEEPFEWVENKSFSVLRRMRGGPITEYALHWTLEKLANGGTKATVKLELTPRFGALRPIVWWNARHFVSGLVKLASEIDAHGRDSAPSPFLKPVSPVDEVALERAVAELASTGVEASVVKGIGSFVREAADADVIRIRPYELAERLGTDRRDTLIALLRGVPAGLVELRWSLVCPSCLTGSQQVRALDEISTEGHCQFCDISFELDLDKAVEATFVAHPAVRKAEDQLFCIGGPSRTPHVVAQATLDAAAQKAIEAPVLPGRYRFFARGGATTPIEVDAEAPAAVDVTVDDSGVHPAHIRVAPSGTLHVSNRTSTALHVKVERIAFTSLAATAHTVSNIAEFRTLFSGDLLKRGTPLKVARVAVLFSDLTGSTALYSKVGDAAAFRFVDDHFDVIRASVEARDGIVVKTMGDAVLTTFTDTDACANAAIDALERFEAFRAAHTHGAHVGLKLGMFTGPCYVVTANGTLDYFGQTVNVASRVQHLAGSGEIVMLRTALDELDAKTRAKLSERENLTARVKGVDEPLKLVRLGLAGAEYIEDVGPMSIQRA